MVKRKVSSSDAVVKASKKAKNTSESIEEIANNCKIDLSTPETVLSSLIKPTSIEDFFTTSWEKKPLHIKRDDNTYLGNLFSLESFEEILKDNELSFESDVNVCRYVNNEKELLNEDGRITVKKMKSLLKDKNATFQLHQPQRYSDALWSLMEKLEAYFGCLFGANVYITPGGSQGLAPHCDDVEIFVMQLEGSKTWKLYKPMVELSRDYTQDLQEGDIGDAIMEVTLNPGDILYFPRGTIHQAKTTDGAHSTHVSLSTYQQYTWGDFLQHAVTQAIDEALEEDVSVRSGLPVGYLKYLGTEKNMNKYIEQDDSEEGKTNALPNNEQNKKVLEFKEKVKTLLTKLIDHIDINTAADAMSADFMGSRLPPYGHEVAEDDEADRKLPTIDDQIKIRYPDHMRVVYSEDDEEDVDMSQLDEGDSEDEDSEEPPCCERGKCSDLPEKMSNCNQRSSEDEKPNKLSKKNGNAAAEKPKKAALKKQNKSTSDTTADEDEDDDAIAELDEEPCIRIVHSLNNSRESHMIGESFSQMGGVLKLPLHFASAAIQLKNATDFVAVKDLPLEDDEEKITLVATLFADDLIEIK